MATAAVEVRQRELVERLLLTSMAFIEGKASSAEEDHETRVSVGLALIREVQEHCARIAEDHAILVMGDRTDYAAEMCDGIAARIREGLAFQ